jgi:hypothetical protein
MPGSLTINRYLANCRVSGTSAAALDVRDRTDRALRGHLTRELRGKLGGWLDRDDESVWIIRHLDLTMLTEPNTPPDALAGYLADSLSRALSNVLREDGDNVNAVRFRSRAAYVAQFVVDLARGDPWGRWYYAPFEGLKLLPRSAAIRTTLIEDPHQGIAALDSMDDRQLTVVAESLSIEDEAVVIKQFAPLSARDEATHDAFITAWPGCLRAMHAGIERGTRLFAFVRVPERERGESVAQAIRVLLDGMQEAWRQSVSNGRKQAERIVEALAIPGVVRDGMLAQLNAGGVVARPSSEAPQFTRYGGLCLLMRDLDARPWAAWTAGWPSPPSDSSAQILRWLTTCMCGGRMRARAIFDDRPCRNLFGISRELDAFNVRRWVREVGPHRRVALAKTVGDIGAHSFWNRIVDKIADDVLRDFGRRLPGFAESTPEYLWRNFLDVGAAFECDALQTIVHCDQPPLHFVLSLTGMTRGTEAGRDGNGLPILVFASDAP